jgi:hypothetical protein
MLVHLNPSNIVKFRCREKVYHEAKGHLRFISKELALLEGQKSVKNAPDFQFESQELLTTSTKIIYRIDNSHPKRKAKGQRSIQTASIEAQVPFCLFNILEKKHSMVFNFRNEVTSDTC